jgi:hypothetical protein
LQIVAGQVTATVVKDHQGRHHPVPLDDIKNIDRQHEYAWSFLPHDIALVDAHSEAVQTALKRLGETLFSPGNIQRI